MPDFRLISSLRPLPDRLPANCPTFLTLKLYHNEEMYGNFSNFGNIDLVMVHFTRTPPLFF